jgi:hypothetical protein
MMILSQYHIFELDTINIYSVACRYDNPIFAGVVLIPQSWIYEFGYWCHHHQKSHALQRQNAENLKQIFPGKEYRGLSPNLHIFPRWVCLFCWRKYVDRSWEYINRSVT